MKLSTEGNKALKQVNELYRLIVSKLLQKMNREPDVWLLVEVNIDKAA